MLKYLSCIYSGELIVHVFFLLAAEVAFILILKNKIIYTICDLWKIVPLNSLTWQLVREKQETYYKGKGSD